VITTGTLTKDDLSFIVDSLEESTSAELAAVPIVITTNLSPYDEEFSLCCKKKTKLPAMDDLSRSSVINSIL
jgi:hypothetical protein